MQPGGAVTALAPRENHIDLFITGTDGAVWSTWWGEFTPITLDASVDTASGTVPFQALLSIGASRGTVEITNWWAENDGLPLQWGGSQRGPWKFGTS